jgi:hypothetical protein
MNEAHQPLRDMGRERDRQILGDGRFGQVLERNLVTQAVRLQFSFDGFKGCSPRITSTGR